MGAERTILWRFLAFVCLLRLLVACSKEDYEDAHWSDVTHYAWLNEGINQLNFEILNYLCLDSCSQNQCVSGYQLAQLLAVIHQDADPYAAQIILDLLHMEDMSSSQLQDRFNTVSSFTVVDILQGADGLSILWHHNSITTDTLPRVEGVGGYSFGIRPLGTSTADSFKRVNDSILGYLSDVQSYELADLPDEPMLIGQQVFVSNALWKYYFDPAYHATMPFTTGDYCEISVSAMVLLNDLPYYSDTQMEAVSLPFHNENYQFMILFPHDGVGLSQCLESLDQEYFQSICNNLQSRRLQVYLPKFQFVSTTSLKGALTSLGGGVLFDPSLAALMPVNSDESLYLSDIVQTVGFVSSESGVSESYTPENFDNWSNPSSGLYHMFIDRPFLFFLYHNPSQLIVLAGTVSDP